MLLSCVLERAVSDGSMDLLEASIGTVWGQVEDTNVQGTRLTSTAKEAYSVWEGHHPF